MYKHRRKIAAMALLLVATTIYVVLYTIQSSTISNIYQKTATASRETFWRTLELSKDGLQQLNNGIIGKLIDKEPGFIVDVAILIPTTTNKIKNPSLQKLSLMADCLPSIKATVEPLYNYKVYIGTEQYDYLATHLDEIKSMSAGNVEIIPMIVKGGNMNIVINEIARQAYKDGVEYMVRVNDDTEFITKNWTSLGIKTLSNFDPANVGVVGPTFRQGNTLVMTQDMTHRTHFKIFNYYYPPVLENYYLDDWITKVYQPNRSTKLKTWEVIHSLKQGTRYIPDLSLKKFADMLVTTGKVTIESYSRHKSPCQTSRIISYCLFGSDINFIEGAVANTKIASKIFPGWIVRIYHDDTVPIKTLETLKSDNVQLVNIKTKAPLEPKEMWNLFVVSDPCLERYLIRNIDSRLTAREKAAVYQWIDSGKHFHIMRDHPFYADHYVPNGLWGGIRDSVSDMMSLIQKYMKNSKQYGTVQQFLNIEIWPIAKMSVLQHDSFTCEKYPESASFPTERQGLEFVGSIYRNGKVIKNDLDDFNNASLSTKCKLNNE